MNQFEYTAQVRGGAAIAGTLEAIDTTAATETLNGMGLRNLELRPAERPVARRAISSDDLIFFNDQLAGMAAAGICLDAGLRQLGRDIQSKRLRQVINSVADDVERGKPLHEAIDRHGPQLPPLYSRVVRAGLESGRLSSTLLNLSHHLRLVADTRRMLYEALTYPAVVLLFAVLIGCFVFRFVVPQAENVFLDMGIKLPGTTRLMIAISHALPMILLTAAGIVAGVASFVFVLRRTPFGRRLLERLTLSTPLLGPIMRFSLQARFLRSMAFAVDAGVVLPEALRLSAEATGSSTLFAEADRVAEKVEQGDALDEACRKTRFIPALFGFLIAANTDVSAVRDGLSQLAKACDARAHHAQQLLRGWVSPVAVVVVGILIGQLILAIFMPLVSVMQSVQG